MNKPLLSILSITYNHEEFIAQAIESWLMQETDFDIEIVIGEDCSTDNTFEIINMYKEKYPELIHIITSERNVGMQNNFLRTLKACTGRYIAICEGDDYWTDSQKLQKQVDFLEMNMNYNMCFHNIKIYKQYDKVFVNDYITKPVAQVTTIHDLSITNYIHTPSVVFRNNLGELPQWFDKVPYIDYSLHLLNSLKGNLYKLNDNMGVYRVHENGAMQLYRKLNYSQLEVFNDGLLSLYDYMYSKTSIKLFLTKKEKLFIDQRKNYFKQNKYMQLRIVSFKIIKTKTSFKNYFISISFILFPRILTLLFNKK